MQIVTQVIFDVTERQVISDCYLSITVAFPDTGPQQAIDTLAGARARQLGEAQAALELVSRALSLLPDHPQRSNTD